MIPDRFEQQAAVRGDRRAIASGSWQPGYAELNAAANHLAHALLARGGARGDRVTLLMRHDGPLIAAVLAVWKAGRILVVLNPSDPPARLRQVLADADSALFVSDPQHMDLAKLIAAVPAQIVCFEDHFSSDPSPNPEITGAPDDAVCLAYTSGSTGLPKGVIGTHRTFLHHVQRCSLGMEVRADDRIALFSSLGGGHGLGTMGCALLNGAAICPHPLTKEGTDGLADWITRCAITILVVSASVFRRLMKTLAEDFRFPKVRVVRIGSEAISADDFALFRRHFRDDSFLLHTYSTSESGNVAQMRFAHGDRIAHGRLPAGHAAEGMEVLLCDDQGRDVAQGATGDIIVQSRFLSPGYWRNAPLTDKHFSTASNDSAFRRYRTGDMGRITNDGLLDFVGRKNDRVKIQGHSVELAEIKAALLQQPDVGGAAVFTKTDARSEDQIVACIIPRASRVPDSSAVRHALRRTLPAHMIPAAIAIFDEFPLTPTGKPDHQEMMARLEKQSPDEVVAPRTEMEARIAKIWSRSLNVSSSGVYDNFFEKGGDSLRAVDLMLGLATELGWDPPMELLLHHPSIAQMAEAIEAGFAGSVRKPWFRWWRASLLAFRRTGSHAPLVFILGGYTSENELLVCAGLLPHLDADRPVFGVRLNLHALRVLRPGSLRAIARRIARRVLRQNFSSTPVLIGECQSSALALEVGQVLSRKLKSPPPLLLLDSWQPRQQSTDGKVHPPAIARYYQLSRDYEPRAYVGKVHIVCSEDSQRLQPCLDWWSARLHTDCQGHIVQGNHHSYIRQHRKILAGTINAICREE